MSTKELKELNGPATVRKVVMEFYHNVLDEEEHSPKTTSILVYELSMRSRMRLFLKDEVHISQTIYSCQTLTLTLVSLIHLSLMSDNYQSHFFLLKYTKSIITTINITPHATKYPYFHWSSGIISKFIP